jgi:hypothetical protein
MREQPPPLPPQKNDARRHYDQMADKIGLVPNLRKKDNLYQGVAVVIGLLLGAAVGWRWKGWPEGLLLGAVAGLILGTLLSGVALMIVGWIRKS